MTVNELIEKLRAFPPDANVKTSAFRYAGIVDVRDGHPYADKGEALLVTEGDVLRWKQIAGDDE
jgi:hypothetical protein